MGRRQQLLTRGFRVSGWMTKFNMDSGDHCTTTWLQSMSLNCTLDKGSILLCMFYHNFSHTWDALSHSKRLWILEAQGGKFKDKEEFQGKKPISSTRPYVGFLTHIVVILSHMYWAGFFPTVFQSWLPIHTPHDNLTELHAEATVEIFSMDGLV